MTSAIRQLPIITFAFFLIRWLKNWSAGQPLLPWRMSTFMSKWHTLLIITVEL
ncbi:MAG: hypothetical protein ACTSRP_21325 [Candidatus Helarchaeota archaeon]